MSELQLRRLPRAGWAGAGLMLAVVVAGCNSRPSAPPLDDNPVYKNQREGFRFSVPQGWLQRARGEVPAGKLQSERLLVEYKCGSCDQPATLGVSVASLPASTSLSEYVLSSSLTGEKWRLGGAAENFTINGAPAVRITYLLGEGKEETVREVVAFRRGDRVYFFKGYYARSDARSGKILRATIDSVVW